MKIPSFFLVVIFAAACALGQPGQAQQKEKTAAPAPAPAAQLPPPGVTLSEPAYPLPLAERDRIRDLQHVNDQVEIENQKMLLKIEQNRALQALNNGDIQLVAWQFAQLKHIDPSQYDLDPKDIRLVKKKAAAK
jgi:hypothetical protein